MTLHARVEDEVDIRPVVERLKSVLLERFGVDHSTIQVERGPCPDEAAPAPTAPVATPGMKSS